MSPSEGSSGGVSIVRLDEDVPQIDVGPGVEVRHLVGQELMFRVVELAADASLPIDEPDQEHAVFVTAGTVRIAQGERDWEVASESAAMLRVGRGFSLAAVGGAARCHIASTPPNVALVRDLLHLEHADHGFD
ncbi:hypothetical protein [Nocardioides sp. LHG3406-4]|uniref:hypothetical protein n=1 Tax=Nocardioides sp. LHG3406-4 TaxID=2804575 RepID=UPI003CEF035D